MHRAIFAAPYYLFGLALLWAAGIVAVSFTYDPRVFSNAFETWIDEAEDATGLAPLSANGMAELRIWSRGSSGYLWYEAPTSIGFAITEDSIVAHRLHEGRLLRRYAVDSEPVGDAASARRMIASLRGLAELDGSTGAWCGFHGGSHTFEGVIDGMTFSFETDTSCEDNPAIVHSIMAMLPDIS